jgi:DNA-binding NarL/FixJ family response regulator
MKPLTNRQSQLTALVGSGLNNKEVSGATLLTVGSIKVYLSVLYDKLGFGGWGNARVRLCLYETSVEREAVTLLSSLARTLEKNCPGTHFSLIS